MNIWVLRAPRRPGMRTPRYLRAVEVGVAELVDQRMLAKRFHSPATALRWAALHGELLDEFVVEQSPR